MADLLAQLWLWIADAFDDRPVAAVATASSVRPRVSAPNLRPLPASMEAVQHDRDIHRSDDEHGPRMTCNQQDETAEKEDNGRDVEGRAEGAHRLDGIRSTAPAFDVVQELPVLLHTDLRTPLTSTDRSG
jgi:hypothetical protein